MPGPDLDWMFGATVVELHRAIGGGKLQAVMVQKDQKRALLRLSAVWSEEGRILPGGKIVKPCGCEVGTSDHDQDCPRE